MTQTHEAQRMVEGQIRAEQRWICSGRMRVDNISWERRWRV
jgi:hypothetical protein